MTRIAILLSFTLGAACIGCGSGNAGASPEAGAPASSGWEGGSAEAGASAAEGGTVDGGSSGCGKSVVTGYQSPLQIVSSGVARTYHLYVPESYDPSVPYPVVFAFHGDGGTGDALRAAFPIEAQANGGALFVYPDATVESGRSFDIESPYAQNADMIFFTDLLASLEQTHCVDDHRVFATGHSRGGYFVNFLNCRLGTNVLRAVAPQSGSGPYGGPYDASGFMICEAYSAAALLVHGEADDVVPYSDGQYSEAQWAWSNGCGPTTSAYDPSPCIQHDGCDADKPVVWCGIPGMGHVIWPEAPAVIWKFFSSFH